MGSGVASLKSVEQAVKKEDDKQAGTTATAHSPQAVRGGDRG